MGGRAEGHCPPKKFFVQPKIRVGSVQIFGQMSRNIWQNTIKKLTDLGAVITPAPNTFQNWRDMIAVTGSEIQAQKLCPQSQSKRSHMPML